MVVIVKYWYGCKEAKITDFLNRKNNSIVGTSSLLQASNFPENATYIGGIRLVKKTFLA